MVTGIANYNPYYSYSRPNIISGAGVKLDNKHVENISIQLNKSDIISNALKHHDDVIFTPKLIAQLAGVQDNKKSNIAEALSAKEQQQETLNNYRELLNNSEFNYNDQVVELGGGGFDITGNPLKINQGNETREDYINRLKAQGLQTLVVDKKSIDKINKHYDDGLQYKAEVEQFLNSHFDKNTLIALKNNDGSFNEQKLYSFLGYNLKSFHYNDNSVFRNTTSTTADGLNLTQFELPDSTGDLLGTIYNTEKPKNNLLGIDNKSFNENIGQYLIKFGDIRDKIISFGDIKKQIDSLKATDDIFTAIDTKVKNIDSQNRNDVNILLDRLAFDFTSIQPEGGETTRDKNNNLLLDETAIANKNKEDEAIKSQFKNQFLNDDGSLNKDKLSEFLAQTKKEYFKIVKYSDNAQLNNNKTDSEYLKYFDEQLSVKQIYGTYSGTYK